MARGLLLLLAVCVCSLSGTAWAADQASAPAPAHAHADGKLHQHHERDLLLSFRDGITNWAEVKTTWGLAGWTECTSASCEPVCTWGGIECEAVGGYSVSALHLGCQNCAVKMQGQLRPGLQQLRQLTVLHLTNNELSGALPPEWGEPGAFPALLELDMSFNLLNGSIPDAWGAAGPAFASLLSLQLAKNRLTGPFPAAFARANTSFGILQSLNLGDNQFTGSLPPAIGGLRSLRLLSLQGNAFSGSLPPTWEVPAGGGAANDTRRLEQLFLHNNSLTGSLPEAWALLGAFSALRSLWLSNNPLGGSLLAAWGASGAFPALQDLNLSSAGLSGPLPAWGAGLQSLRELVLDDNNVTGDVPASWTGMASLQRVTMQPGNPAMCTQVPAGAAFTLCQAGQMLDSHCVEPLPPDSSQCAVAPLPDSSSSSSFPVAAIAVPVAVVAAAVLAAGSYWVWRRRRMVSTEGGGTDVVGKKASGDLSQDEESALQVSGSTAVLPGPGPDAAAAVLLLSDQRSPLPLGSQSSGSLQGPHSGSLQPQRSGSLPLPPSSGSSLPGRPGSSDTPMFTECELAALRLSDWEIRPEEIAIMKRPDGSDWQLGSGGFGTVYKAMRNGVQPVAVKVLGGTNGGSLKPMSDRDFAQEISILRACRDTNILQFQGACFEANRTLLVTEYMEGGNLTHNIRARRITWWRRGKKVALDVARGLVYLHSRRIIHLDIKSANVLLTREGTAKVGDVGMAKIMAGDYVSGVVGTLAWSAPEMLWGLHTTTKADVYSLGVVLWEIATGELPVRGRLRDPNVPEECPQELLDLINRCLDTDPEKRPKAAEAVELLQLVPGALPPGVACGPPSQGSPFVGGPHNHQGGSQRTSRAGSSSSTEAAAVGAAAAPAAAGSATAERSNRGGGGTGALLGSVLEHQIASEAMAELAANNAATKAQQQPHLPEQPGGTGGKPKQRPLLSIEPAPSLTTSSPFKMIQ